MRRLILTIAAVFSLSAAAPAGLLAQDATPIAAAGEVIDPASCRIEPRSAEEVYALRSDDAPEGDPYADATVKAAPVPLGEPADAETAAAITATIREGYACTNAEDIGRFTALLSDALVGRLIGSIEGITLEIVETVVAADEPRSASDRQRLLAITDVSVMEDGRVAALVVDDDPTEPPDGPETQVLILVVERGRWVVDGILDFTDDEAFEEPEDAATPSADLPGVTGQTYRSPTFGYELAWDAEWTVEYSTVADGQDQLRLTRGTALANFHGVPAGPGSTLSTDPAACLDALVQRLIAEGEPANFSPAPESVGTPIGSGPNVAAGVYVGDATGQSGATAPVAFFLSCRQLSEDAVLVITYAMLQSDAAEAEPLFRELDESLVLAGDATPTAGAPTTTAPTA